MGDIKIVITADSNQATQVLSKFTAGAEEMFGGFLKKIVAAFAVERLIEFGKRIVENADAMGKLSQKTGLSTESLSTWSYVAKLASINQEEFNLGLKTAAG